MNSTTHPPAVADAVHTVGDLARLAGVTVRTLHHYDAIGLLSPSGRTASGYRRYATSDVLRLQRILVYRAIGFDLTTIATILGDPSIDELDHLRRQRDMLNTQLDHIRQMVIAVEKMMETRKMGLNLDPEEMFEVFGDFDPTDHAAEAEARWGNTDAYKESARRTKQYNKADWKRIQAEAAEINEKFVALMNNGIHATSEDAMDIAEQHRQHITRWFYECSYAIHRGLAEMYIADPRFTENIDKAGVGLSSYMRDAIIANADRADGET